MRSWCALIGLVTLTGVGGVGKTRLAVQVAAELTGEFADGVWLVELAPVGDPAAVPDVVATVLGVTPQAGMSVTASIVQALSGRRLLIVLDNCEHVLDAAADLVEAILAGTVDGEGAGDHPGRAAGRRGAVVAGAVARMWTAGSASAAVELFVERARAVNAGVRRCTTTPTVDAVSGDLCAAGWDRVGDRVGRGADGVDEPRRTSGTGLSDRFRLLAGGRGAGWNAIRRLRHAVGWSFDLLDDDERACCVVVRCSPTGSTSPRPLSSAGRASTSTRCWTCWIRWSASRWSPSTRRGGTPATGCWKRSASTPKTSSPPPAASTRSGTVTPRTSPPRRCRWWDRWDGPGYDAASDWVDAEFANLRAGFRWAADRDDLVTATAIAAHTAMLGLRAAACSNRSVGPRRSSTPPPPPTWRNYPGSTPPPACAAFTGRAEVAVGYARDRRRVGSRSPL